jgi:DNA repair exonuclease SbcCD ATPase subunit
MDKTVKLRAYTEPGKVKVPQASSVQEDHKKSLELTHKNAQIEEERQKSLDHVKTIMQLRENLKKEVAHTAELDAKLIELAGHEANEIAKRNALLEEEKKRSLELLKTVDQLRENLKQEQTKKSNVVDKSNELEAKTKEVVVLEAKVKELTAVLSKISSIATAGKLV